MVALSKKCLRSTVHYGARGEKSKRKCLTFTPSEAPQSPDIWVAHMKGTLVVGQRADSAAGYCPSNTLRRRENIVIHLHLFSSQPGKHSHKHKLVETQKCTHIK